MIEVYKTNVADKSTADETAQLLSAHYPGLKINFDLDDCDRILRIEGHHFQPAIIAGQLHALGIICEVLE